MKPAQYAWNQVLLLIFSVLGAGVAIYLTTVHYENVPLVCSESGPVNCGRVLSSLYSVVPGTPVPITIPGLAWCAVMAALAIAGLYSVSQRRWLYRAQFAWALLGMLAILYLVYVEIVRLHTICAWCSAFHVFVLLMFLVTVVQLQALPSAAEAPAEEAEDEEAAAHTLPHSR